MRDAMALDLSMSAIVRRLVEIYLEDQTLRKRVVNYNLQCVLSDTKTHLKS